MFSKVRTGTTKDEDEDGCAAISEVTVIGPNRSAGNHHVTILMT